MFRSIRFFKRFYTFVAPALALALIVAAFFFSGQHFVTVAKAAADPQPTLGPLPSFVLDIIGTGSGAQTLTPVLFSLYPQRIDLGDGYVLELTANGGQILAPATALNVQPADYFQTIYLTDGYMVEITASGGQIVAPQSVLNTVPQPAAALKTIDLGDGYVLVLTASGGQIVAPAAPFPATDQVSYVKKIDLGSGYWLIITQDGGQIVREGTK